MEVSLGLKDDPTEPLVNLTVPDPAAPVHPLPFRWLWVIREQRLWVLPRSSTALPASRHGTFPLRSVWVWGARSQECHRLQAPPLHPRSSDHVCSHLSLLWLCLSVSLLSFVQLGWLVCFFDQIFLHPQASVHFVCACHGGYRSLISVSHLEGLQSPASALLRACLSWGTSFQRPHWTQIKENISKFKSIPLISGLSLIWGTTFQNWKDKLLAMHLMNSVEKHILCPSFEEAFLSEWSTVFHILITIY